MVAEGRQAARYSEEEISRLVGAPVATLREWRRRFALIEPETSPMGEVYYNDVDLEELRFVVGLVARGVSPEQAHRRLVARRKPLAVGAPSYDFIPPPEDTAAGRLYRLVTARSDELQLWLSEMRQLCGLGSAFIVCNFLHPEAGPSGAILLIDYPTPPAPIGARLQRVSVMPLSELEDLADRFGRGEELVMRPAELPPRQQLRFSGTQVRWVIHTPILAHGEWVGIVGGSLNDGDPRPSDVAALRALRDVIAAELDLEEADRRYLSTFGAALD